MKSILFDLDGTLVNSSPGIKAAYATLLKDYSYLYRLTSNCQHSSVHP
ncbi:Phosphoglycolate phosphatase [Streptococcus pasteurianus]|nr:Phosphoglycolate phosphatase [Streptococcus pasteurianus]